MTDKPRLYVPEGADDRRGKDDYKQTRIGFVTEPQLASAVEFVTFDRSETPA